MSSFALSMLERIYLQVESAYGTIPNTDGTASVAGANACRFVNFVADNEVAMIERPDKNGTFSAPIGAAGRKSARWSASMSIAPNGVAGTQPDMDPLLQMTFGQAGEAVAGSKTITAATNATPVVCTSTAHGFSNGDVVFISGATGLTAMNGVWVIGSVATDTFTLVGSEGNGVFGGTVTASRVAYKYALSDAVKTGALWSFRQPAGIDQRVVSGAIVQEATFQLGADVATCSFSGEGKWALSSNQFTGADAYQKAGLTAFPTEPVSPVTNGGIIAGFTGKVAVAGKNIATLQTATVRIQTGKTLVRDAFGSYYATGVEGARRRVSVQFSLYEDDSAAFAALIAAAEAKTPVQIPLFMGTVSGSIFGVVLNNVQLATPTRSETQRFVANFGESQAKATSMGALDECYAVFI